MITQEKELSVHATNAAFGISVNSHLFRDCAATLLADEEPVHVGAAVPLLGHANLNTTERFYIQATSRNAVRDYQVTLSRLRKADKEDR